MLAASATRLVDATADDPEARMRSREAFYARHGFDAAFQRFGRAELAFARWMITRGVLASPTDTERPGSAWWRAVNRDLHYYSELAALVREAHIEDQDDLGAPVRHWLSFFAEPSAQTWYRAHNASLLQSCLDNRALAENEDEYERAFLNIVLYRVLATQALAERAPSPVSALERLSDPRLPLVELFVSVTGLYPRHYPARAEDVRRAHFDGLSRDGEPWHQRLSDAYSLTSSELVPLVAEWLAMPEVARLGFDDRLSYPDLAPLGRGASAMPPPDGAPRKRRIAILGGGPAGLAAAWELTNSADWKDRYDVTVYTLGFRLGGKIATGRGPNQRVEEHGLHIFQGWYHNAFRLFQDVFDERRLLELDPGAPYSTLDDALVPESSTLITEWVPEERRWDAWQLELPRNDRRPGRGAPLSTDELVVKGLKVLVSVALGGPREGDTALRRRVLETLFHEPPATRVAGRPDDAPHGPKPGLDRAGMLLARRLLTSRAVSLATRRLRARWLRRAPGRRRRVAVLAELAEAILRGLLADVYDATAHELDFARIDHLDFRDWLRKHGASERVTSSGLVRFAYTGTFSDMTERDHGRLAAGTALRIGLMASGFKGAFVWKLKAGAGDTLVAPLFQVLRARGVRFEFFRRVEQVHDSRTGTIDEITLAEQAHLAGAAPYDPLVFHEGLATWPSKPRYEQLAKDHADALVAADIDLESPWAPWRDVGRRSLRRGVDFDDVILAIPVAALRGVCREIAAHRPRFRQMVNGVRTTQTLGVQLWLKPSLEELGLERSKLGMRASASPNLVTYANPVYSWLDLSMLLPGEAWGKGGPKSCAYFCGPLPDAASIPGFDDHGFPERERQRVKETMNRWLDANIAFLWPRAMREGQFDRDLLFAPDGVHGDDRLDAQWFKANIEPSARYTLAYPDTHRHRLRTDESGFANLWLAGDWVDYGINVGYVEGAVTSGLQAAHALRRASGLSVNETPYVNLTLPKR